MEKKSYPSSAKHSQAESSAFTETEPTPAAHHGQGGEFELKQKTPPENA